MGAEDLLRDLVHSPSIKAFLEEHSRRENLPRKACRYCQFEYTEEDNHCCKEHPCAT